MNKIVSYFSFAGKKSSNQDSFLCLELKKIVVLAVADGMGGHSAGNIASSLCIATVESFFKKNDINTFSKEVFSECIQEVIGALKEYAMKHPEDADLGTTLSLSVVLDNELFIAHVGDSRIYLLRSNGIKSLTKDQTEVQYLLDQKIINGTEAKRYKRKNVLLSVLNAKNQHSLDAAYHKLEQGDRVVLMTDGCYGNLSKVEIRDLSSSSDDVKQLADSILSKVESREIKDDYTAVLYQH